MEYLYNVWYWFKDRFGESSSWLGLFIWFKEIGIDINPILEGHLMVLLAAGVSVIAFVFKDKG